jgi:hypothetical protein
MIKNKNMSTETQEQTKAKMYVWARTERAGDIVTVEGTEDQFTTFTDGTRCATKLIGEMLMEARDEANAESLAKSFKILEEPQLDSTPVEETTKKETTTADNVMIDVLRKVSAKNTITMPLEINIPSKEVYTLLVDQIDEDLNEHVLELVLSQIDNLQQQLKPQAEEFIKNYYNGKGTKANTRRKSTNSGGDSSAPDITY